MKRVVLIDGENLVYGLRSILGRNGEMAPRSVVDNFDFKGLIEDLLADKSPEEILWFGARLRRYDQSEDLRLKSEAAIRHQAKFMNHIQSQQIRFIKVGYLRARESEPCKKCSHQTWRLTEKGVDVGLAVRMITEANKKTELAIVSADTDLIPAFKASLKLGAKIMHIGYENKPINALSRASATTRTITLPLAQKYLSTPNKKDSKSSNKKTKTSGRSKP